MYCFEEKKKYYLIFRDIFDWYFIVLPIFFFYIGFIELYNIYLKKTNNKYWQDICWICFSIKILFG